MSADDKFEILDEGEQCFIGETCLVAGTKQLMPKGYGICLIDTGDIRIGKFNGYAYDVGKFINILN